MPTVVRTPTTGPYWYCSDARLPGFLRRRVPIPVDIGGKTVRGDAGRNGAAGLERARIAAWSIIETVVTDDYAARIIQRDYLDNADRPASLDQVTVDALSAALGTPDADLDERAPVVVRPGDPLRTDLGPVAAVVLEDGSEREFDPAAGIDLPLGYHWLQTPNGRRRLIVSPGVCVLPSRREWGWAAQLYATRSRSSWGIGDLGDLRRLGTLTRELGGGFVLVNPLHAGGGSGAGAAQQSSPYMPSSRRFFSPLYLNVAEMDGAGEILGERLADFDRQGRALNEDRRIDRDAVWRVKQAALRAVFDGTRAAGLEPFTAWRRQRGIVVEQFAAWSVLSAQFASSWRSWPEGARRPDGPLVAQVVAQHADDVTFAAWLQWLCEQQLRAAGRGVRVLQDLPIGVDPDGADAWAMQDVLAEGVTVGAPADPFNLAGQDWGLPPFVPWRLQLANYQPFIDAIQSTMALAGGLRVDHVMGLFRLWWVPQGMSADRGGYVRYPSSDMLDIVALESVRAGAPVVGEDLGTVEAGVRPELAARNILSYRLLWFEKDPPSQWPSTSLAAVGTHDLPTVAGLWTGSDLADQRASGLDADEEATQRLRDLLVDDAGVPADASTADAVRGAYGLLAQAPSILLGASVEDAIVEPVRPNIPGTSERPNWSAALPVALDDFADHPSLVALAGQLDRAVKQ